MKNAIFTFLLLLSANLIFSQNIEEEYKVLEDLKIDKRNLQQRGIGDISGICDLYTVVTNQEADTGWDQCDRNEYEGTAEFESVDGELYNVYTINDMSEQINDLSFGSYYACIEVQDQSSMPNSNATSPTLHFKVNNLGVLSFNGSSQWGEVYSLDSVEMEEAELSFKWTNDYGEGARVNLTRQDGQFWEDLLTPCVFDSEEDSLALVALYNATDGFNWNIPWDLNSPVSEWYGVTIDEEICRVTEIDMGSSAELIALGFIGNNLTGEVPEEIANLAHLEILDLSRNQLEGEVLPKVTDLVNLEILSLSSNAFTGTIIPELANLINLEFFSISINNMDGVLPAEVSTIPNLRSFFASRNNLSGEIPSEFGNFQSLRSLSMWGNNFSGELPSELGNVETLQNLTLDFNNLTGEIPPSIGELPILSVFRVSFNQLEGSIPEGFPFINVIRLNDNDLSGEMPENFATLFGINEINVANNNLSGPIPSRLILNDSFQELYFSNNDFSGCVDSIENLCLKPHNPVLDTVTIHGVEYYSSYSRGYDFGGNPKLAWEGQIQNTCMNEPQIGAPCNDGDPNTENESINPNCECTETVSTNDIEELNSITISPNPLSSGGLFHVSLDLEKNTNIGVVLLDLNGKVILNKSLEMNRGSNNFTIDSNGLSTGLYFIQLSTIDGTSSRKIVIQ